MQSSEIQFTASQVRRSIVRFKDYGNDLARSNSGTLQDRLNLFLDFCEKDEVFSQISSQLKLIGKDINYEEWWKSITDIDNGSLIFPTDEDQRIFIMFALLADVQSDDSVNSAMGISHRFNLSYSTNVDQLIMSFHNTITTPLVRELGYKFGDMLDNLPEDNKARVLPATFQIFHAQTVISQNAQGDNITQTANIENDSELENLFENLKKLIKKEIPSDDKEDSLTLVDAAKNAALAAKDQSKAKSFLNTLKKIINSAPILAKGADDVVNSIEHIASNLHHLM